MNKKYRILTVLIAAFVMFASLAGCGSGTSESIDLDGTYVYYLNSGEDKLVPVACTIPEGSTEDGIAYLRTALSVVPKGYSAQPLLPSGVTLDNTEFEGRELRLYFSNSYSAIEPTREILVRAGIVRTFCQVSGVRECRFYIGGEPLMDDAGREVGAMRQATFIDSSVQRINAYERDSVYLYFGNATGDALRLERRVIYHSSNQPLEWAVVARLIEGSAEEGMVRLIAPDTEIISVSTAKEICYVNLSRAFLASSPDTVPELAIYSIVNSLARSCNVKQVQIAIEGDIKVMYRDTVSLDQLFEEKVSYVEQSREEE